MLASILDNGLGLFPVVLHLQMLPPVPIEHVAQHTFARQVPCHELNLLNYSAPTYGLDCTNRLYLMKL